MTSHRSTGRRHRRWVYLGKNDEVPCILDHLELVVRVADLEVLDVAVEELFRVDFLHRVGDLAKELWMVMFCEGGKNSGW